MNAPSNLTLILKIILSPHQISKHANISGFTSKYLETFTDVSSLTVVCWNTEQTGSSYVGFIGSTEKLNTIAFLIALEVSVCWSAASSNLLSSGFTYSLCLRYVRESFESQFNIWYMSWGENFYGYAELAEIIFMFMRKCDVMKREPQKRFWNHKKFEYLHVLSFQSN